MLLREFRARSDFEFFNRGKADIERASIQVRFDPSRTLGRSVWGRSAALSHSLPDSKVLNFKH
jgi:hypothetical protein